MTVQGGTLQVLPNFACLAAFAVRNLSRLLDLANIELRALLRRRTLLACLHKRKRNHTLPKVAQFWPQSRALRVSRPPLLSLIPRKR